jgi:glutamine amidotransferase
MKIAVIKYNSGNVQSVLYALERLGADAELTDDPEKIRAADKVIFPGQGEASTAMAYLKARKLDTLIKELKQPFLGVCLGLQLLCEHTEENDTACLGVFPVKVKRFIPENSQEFKVPHVGWNELENLTADPLLHGLPANPFVYYVHSFYAELSEYTIATTHYIHDFSAILHRDNFWAIQAHPEKSSMVGEKLLANFLGI